MSEQQTSTDKIALTAFAHGAGCGCKIAPAMLQQILHTDQRRAVPEALLVGHESNDDAAVYMLNEELALIATTDFFTPVVDDPFLFGRIAAANAISDVYAMGGMPLLATAILGFPVDTLPLTVATAIIEGARQTCAEAGIPLAGGHSIDNKEPIFGLSVNGSVRPENLKRNNTATAGDLLLLTKPIGSGVLSAAGKRGLLEAGHVAEWEAVLTALNKAGAALGLIPGVTAMTDVTGFGLLGHLYEMASGSGLSAELYYDSIPVLAAARHYAAQRIVPDATYRNWNAYSTHVRFEPGVNVMEAFNLLPDPQTNGGLLVAVKEESLAEVQEILKNSGLSGLTSPVGRMIAAEEKTILVK